MAFGEAKLEKARLWTFVPMAGQESISVPDSYITENGSTFTSVDISLNSTLSIVGSQGENNGKPTIDLQVLAAQ